MDSRDTRTAMKILTERIRTYFIKIEGVDFTTTQTIKLGDSRGLAPNRRMTLLKAFILSTSIATLSAGATVKLEEVNPTKTKATLSTNLTGNTNNDLKFTAVDGGTAGNDITIRYLNTGLPNVAESVSVTGKAITVTLATGAGTPELETATASGTIRAAVAQVETLTVGETVPGTLTAGNANVVVTASGMTNSPKTLAVGLATNDTEAQVAAKVRTALANDTDVSAYFTVSGSGTAVVLTRKAAVANDATNNISIADGTCTGLVAVVNSSNTTAGVATGAGNASVVVTATGMTGSPITLSVAVADGDTTATWAAKVRTALAANAVIAALFTVGGSSASITLTKTIAAADISNLNIALDNGTCAGINTAASSANTTPGVAPAITSTGATVAASVAASAPASALVTVANKSGNDGTGLAEAMSATNLTGGLEYTVVSTLVASGSLSNTDAENKIQTLDVSSAGALAANNQILLTITGGTAGTDMKDVYLEVVESLPS